MDFNMDYNADITKPLFVHEQVRANKIKTVVLLLFFGAMIIGISYLIGYIYDNVVIGVVIGAAYCGLVIPLQLASARRTLVSS
ncbi:MAG: hypothetical protein ACERKO_07440, partial [Acetanaerobacterium sp.]